MTDEKTDFKNDAQLSKPPLELKVPGQSAPLVGTTVSDRYLIESLLGSGALFSGMSYV